MKPAAFQLSFQHLSTPQEPIQIDFLPCQFQSNLDTTNRDVYFDPLVRPHKDQKNLLETSLQGRKLVGRELALGGDYVGRVMGRAQIGYDENGERIECENIAEFTRITEWKKDAWTDERGYAGNIVEYIECSKIMNEEDEL